MIVINVTIVSDVKDVQAVVPGALSLFLHFVKEEIKDHTVVTDVQN